MTSSTEATASLEGKFVHFLKPHWDTLQVVDKATDRDNTFNCKIQCKPRPMLVLQGRPHRRGLRQFLVLPVSSKRRKGDFPLGNLLSNTISFARLDEVEWIGEALIHDRNAADEIVPCDPNTYRTLYKLAADYALKGNITTNTAGAKLNGKSKSFPKLF